MFYYGRLSAYVGINKIMILILLRLEVITSICPLQIFYKPIMINSKACLKCHGEPGKHIAAETSEKIKERYPNDFATGFRLNEFRGSWKITFRK